MQTRGITYERKYGVMQCAHTQNTPFVGLSRWSEGAHAKKAPEISIDILHRSHSRVFMKNGSAHVPQTICVTAGHD